MGTGKGSQDPGRGLEKLNIRLMQVPEVAGKEEGNVWGGKRWEFSRVNKGQEVQTEGTY